MILRRYGATLRSVRPDFDPRAMTEVGFRRDGEMELPAQSFEAGYERMRGVELTAESEGSVQIDAERALLETLQGKLEALEAEAGEGELLMIESEPGRDHPKPHEKRRNVVVEGENRFYFQWRIDPPLRVGVYRRKEE